MKPIWDRLNVELLITQFVAWLPSLVAALAIMLFFWAIFRTTRPALRHVLMRTGFEEAFAGMIVNVYRFALVAFGVVMAASQLGINVGAALAGLGVVGLTIGFAAKDSLSNLMAGFLIFWDKPFHVGNWITVGNYHGTVSQITMRTTRLRTRDNTSVIIPNETVINQIVVNHSSNGRTRLEIPLGIGYPQRIPEAKHAILEAVQSVECVLRDPAPDVVVKNLGASGVDLVIFAWIANAKDAQPTYFQILEAAKMSLDKAGIGTPPPRMDIALVAIEGGVWAEAGKLAQAPR
ncbi:MAG: mechanosensitive ion channel [Acidobacteriaceae bacterium]|nr:mechanosensitive ion channel [Acidobacteriaceae bacterium]MBV9296656.1 mechanosensitive ion channel [Acidobacteriaceae bacterium]MBV9766022.1 mechanosensitive ion channel [Acidobacteriaceae bacterium]